VADGAWVRVYDEAGKQLTAFAPYSSNFAGDVNIAVGTLYGGKRRYIVTGKSTGTAEVKIYDLSGRQLRSCTPYASSFQGGVNVGIGHLGGGKGLQIIVSAGYGGGPHIRILNNRCRLIDPGFFAFDSDLRIGVNMAVGDVDGDGTAEIIAGQGPGGPPQIRVFHKVGKVWKQTGKTFYAYKKSDRSGVLVSTIDMNDDGKSEIVTSSFSLFNSLF
jgi:serralysin